VNTQIVQYNWIKEKKQEGILVDESRPHALQEHPFTKISDKL
jgi:hypothetical protein